MIQITRRYHFEAAHFLPKVPEGHKCKRMHGHNYEIEVTVAKPLGKDGFLMDFADLDKLVQPIIDKIDHRTLNDIKGLENPTAELIGQWFMDKLAKHDVHGIRVYETKDCWSTIWRPADE
jgi:6-pyruvoyltetrahydropterin/6-carboxytetrahydropterin synthase